MAKQQGFALLELIVALLIATVLAVFAAERFAQRNKELMAQGHAVWMAGLRQATLRYLEQHGVALHVNGDHAFISGYSDPMSPTLDELKGAGLLARGYPAFGARAVGARIQLLRSGNCPQNPCRLDALIYSDTSLAVNSEHDGPALTAYWLAASQGLGGAVMFGREHTVGGPSFSFSNPPASNMSTLPVGTVALAITDEQLNSLAYLRVRDDRDPDFQGSASIAGHVGIGGRASIRDHIYIETQADAHAFCADAGAIVRERYGGLLVCRSGRWRSAGGSGGGGYSVNTMTGCISAAANPVTEACSCPPDYTPVLISDSTSAIPAQGRTRGYMCVG